MGSPTRKLCYHGPWPVGMCAWCQVLLRFTTARAPRVSWGLGAPTHSQNLLSQLSDGAGGPGGRLGQPLGLVCPVRDGPCPGALPPGLQMGMEGAALSLLLWL